MKKQKTFAELKAEYDNVCNEIISAFCKKQEMDLEFWVSDEIGGIACFGDCYFLNFSDIIYDLENKCRKGKILNWIDYCVEHERITYKNYLKLKL